MLIGKHFFSLSRVQVFLLSISLVNWQLIKQIGINEDFNDLKKKYKCSFAAIDKILSFYNYKLFNLNYSSIGVGWGTD